MTNISTEILLIEDDKSIARFISLSLKSQGYKCTHVETAGAGLSLFGTNKVDLILLDLGLPDMDGMEVLMQVRELESKNNLAQTPIIIVSARDTESDIVTALDSGADDYITKPFKPLELNARIRTALRKSQKEVASEKEIFSFDGLEIDFEKRLVSVDGEEVHLTPTEYKLLCLLTASKGKVLTHRYISEQVWGHLAVEDFQFVRVTLANLRKKIEKSSTGRYIITETGVGYRFREE